MGRRMKGSEMLMASVGRPPALGGDGAPARGAGEARRARRSKAR